MSDNPLSDFFYHKNDDKNSEFGNTEKSRQQNERVDIDNNLNVDSDLYVKKTEVDLYDFSNSTGGNNFNKCSYFYGNESNGKSNFPSTVDHDRLNQGSRYHNIDLDLHNNCGCEDEDEEDIFVFEKSPEVLSNDDTCTWMTKASENRNDSCNTINYSISCDNDYLCNDGICINNEISDNSMYLMMAKSFLDEVVNGIEFMALDPVSQSEIPRSCYIYMNFTTDETTQMTDCANDNLQSVFHSGAKSQSNISNVNLNVTKEEIHFSNEERNIDVNESKIVNCECPNSNSNDVSSEVNSKCKANTSTSSDCKGFEANVRVNEMQKNVQKKSDEINSNNQQFIPYDEDNDKAENNKGMVIFNSNKQDSESTDTDSSLNNLISDNHSLNIDHQNQSITRPTTTTIVGDNTHTTDYKNSILSSPTDTDVQSNCYGNEIGQSDVSNQFGCRMKPFENLEMLCVSNANLSSLKDLNVLSSFPKLTNLRLQCNPLFSSVNLEDRRKLYIARFVEIFMFSFLFGFWVVFFLLVLVLFFCFVGFDFCLSLKFVCKNRLVMGVFMWYAISLII